MGQSIQEWTAFKRFERLKFENFKHPSKFLKAVFHVLTVCHILTTFTADFSPKIC